MNNRIRAFVRLALIVVLTSCGGGSSSPPPAVPAVVVTIAPTTVTLKPGDVQGFAATITGTSNTAVNWTVQEGAAGGSIDSAGTYFAPINNGTFHVIATSQADTSQSATAAVTVAGTFVVSPSSDVLGPLGVRAFTATVAVTWSVQEGAAGGAITTDGLYTAPNAAGLFHVVATSVQDPSKNTIAQVTVVSSGFFLATGAMSTGRTAHTATLLQSGRVLITGGDSCYFFSYYIGHCLLDSAEIYDPGAGTFATTGKMSAKRYFHTATLLTNDKVLVTGGPDASAELYDSTSGTFAATGGMSVGRSAHTATRLANGNVLIAGGHGVAGVLATAELYDPSTGLFKATGTMTAARTAHTATLLANGKVLIAGGANSTGALATAELYDPATGSFTLTGSMTGKREWHAATLLGTSNVLVTGGQDQVVELSSAEVYDVATGAFTVTGSMMTAHQPAFAILLANGKALVSGGYNNFTAELYDAGSGLFAQTGSMAIARVGPAVVLLQDGRVFVSGGSDSSSAELYQ